LTSGNSFIERLQAARHSTLVMCVAASQKPMQSASDLPPPPGALFADSLGLLLPEFPGERARFGEPPPPVANWLGKGSDMGASPGCAVGPVGVATPPGGVNPPDGVGDTDVDGAAGVVELEVELELELGDARVVVGAETLGAARDGALLVEERACANAASGSSSKTAMAAKADGLGVSIAITMAFAGSTPNLVTIGCRFCGVHKLASQANVARCCGNACSHGRNPRFRWTGRRPRGSGPTSPRLVEARSSRINPEPCSRHIDRHVDWHGHR
jgi:hypothetical protein